MARAIKLINAPVGLFDIDGVLVLKTEYSTQHEDGAITPDCYIVDSGEYFWGGVDSVAERNNLMVTPIDMPALTPPNEPERAGLYGKYIVYKNKDGSLVTDCFILRPEKDPAAVAALRAYAAATDNAELAADIINWVGAEPNEPLTLEQLREMDGEPVWVEFEDGSGGLWGIVHITIFAQIVFANGLHCTIGERYYGKSYKAYRRPPEGEEDT